MVLILLRKEKRVSKSNFMMTALLGVLLPASGFANNEFRVSQTTGLELDTPASLSHDSGGSDTKKKGEAEPGVKKPTEITASRETTFDEKARVAVFSGDVTVVDTQFNLTCDKLTAYLKKPGADAKADAKGDAKADATAEKKGGPEVGGGLDRVLAEGNVVITQEKAAANGEVTRYVGKAAKAEYNAATGDVTLKGWPQIQQGINNQVATAEGTVMILNKSGRLKTIGPSKTEIKDSSDKDLMKVGKSESSRPN